MWEYISEFFRVERDKAKLKEIYDALEISNNAVLKNFDHLNKKDAEMAEKVSNISSDNIFSQQYYLAEWIWIIWHL